MIDNYTREANERCFKLAQSDVDEVFRDIAATDADTDADRWKKKLNRIAAEYVFSARFALIRLLDGNAAQMNAQDAAQMDAQGLYELEDRLLSRAGGAASSRGEAFDEASCRDLIRRALMTEEKRRTLLTREEAMRLLHDLGVSLEEASWFLLRVFDFDDGFCYNRSGDLIDAYCFLTNGSARRAQELSAQYEARTQGTEKSAQEEKQADWTRGASESLPDLCCAWPADKRDESFLNWLCERAPLLDIPSQSALTVFRNLVTAAANPAKIDWQGEDDLTGLALALTYDGEETPLCRASLYAGGVLSEEKCAEVAERLLLDNQTVSHSAQPDRAKAYHVITTQKNGTISIAAGVNAQRSRVFDLLTGRENVQKSDVLYAVWFLANFCWDGEMCAPDRTRRLQELINAASVCLDCAMLPPFYPPHLMEQSMMLAVISSDAGSDPAVAYETICSAVPAKRARRTKHK